MSQGSGRTLHTPRADLTGAAPEIRALLDRLGQRWPAVFDPDAPRPLALRIHATILAAWSEAEALEPDLLSAALEVWTKTPAYIQTLAKDGAQRYGLDGQPVKPVADKHREQARMQLASTDTEREQIRRALILIDRRLHRDARRRTHAARVAKQAVKEKRAAERKAVRKKALAEVRAEKVQKQQASVARPYAEVNPPAFVTPDPATQALDRSGTGRQGPTVVTKRRRRIVKPPQ